MPEPDPVDVWHGLRGSRDWPVVVSAGEQLCRSLEAARVAWQQAARQRARDVAALDDHILELEAQLTVTDEPSGLDVAVRSWHEAEHADGWAVCPHSVCRAVG